MALRRSYETAEKIERLLKSDAIKELEKLHKENIKMIRPEELTGALKGRYAMIQQMDTMIKNAKKSVNLLTTEGGLKELVENHSNILKKASDSGVKIQIAAPFTKTTVDIAKDLSKYANVRNIKDAELVEKLIGRVCVVDGQEFLVGLTDDTKTHPTQDVALWTQSSHASSNVFEPMFDLVWHHAKPIK